MIKKVIIIGGGGHARVLADILLRQNDRYDLLGFADNDRSKWSTNILGKPVLGGDDDILGRLPDSFFLANGIGSTRETRKRAEIFSFFESKGYRFCDVISDFSYLSGDATYGEGLKLIAGAIIHPGCRIGKNVLVNTKASLDHDCVVGDHAHIAPGATLSGGVTLGAGVHIGSGATIIQGISIGEGSFVAAGAVVTGNLPENAVVAGVPAKSVDCSRDEAGGIS